MSASPTKLVRKPVGTVSLTDSFDDASKGVLPALSAQPAKFSVGYVDGEYLIATVDPSYDRIPSAGLPGEYTDVSIAVDVRFLLDQSQYASLQCRSGAAGAYRLSVDPHQSSFAISKVLANGDISPLVDWRYSEEIFGGTKANRIELACVGQTVSAWVNGIQLASVENLSLDAGALWIGSGRYRGDTTTLVDARFDNLVVTEVKR